MVGVPKIAAKGAKVVEGIRSSKATTLQHLSFLVHSPAGHGKTTFAATGSKFYESGEPLSDQLWIMADVGGLDTLASQGLECPYVFDIPFLMAEYKLNVIQVIAKLSSSINPLLESNPGITQIVIDTITSLDSLLVEHLDKNCPMTKSNQRDTRGMWGQLAAQHTGLFHYLTSLRRSTVWIAHQQAVDLDAAEKSSKGAKDKLKSTMLPGDPTIIPGVTGKSSKMYVNNASLVGALLAVKEPGVGNKFTRKLFFEHNLMAAKNRFGSKLNTEEAPNLRAIFEKCGIVNI